MEEDRQSAYRKSIYNTMVARIEAVDSMIYNRYKSTIIHNNKQYNVHKMICMSNSRDPADVDRCIRAIENKNSQVTDTLDRYKHVLSKCIDDTYASYIDDNSGHVDTSVPLIHRCFDQFEKSVLDSLG